jgi:DNA-directed RNA polymerase subunit RPC12/RpoP
MPKNYKLKRITGKVKSGWANNEKLIVVLQCRNCGRYNEIDGEYNTLNCKCGKNLVVWHCINHLNSKVIYRAKGFDLDSVKNYSTYKYS